MKIEHLVGELADGSRVKVIKTQEPISGHPSILKLPKFTLEGGEHLNAIDDTLRIFKSIRTNKIVKLLE